MNRILVTGGSGFVGTHLIRRLLDEHPDLEIHNLDLVPSDLPVTEHLLPVEDQTSYESLPEVDAVVHLAAVSREPGFPTHRYYRVNTEGTALLADWAVRTGVLQIVFYSSIGVYGPTEDPTDEGAPTYPETPYGMSKLLGEQELRAHTEGASTSVAVIRPGVVFGEGDDGNFARLARAVQQGWFVFPGRSDTRKAAIYVHDVVDLTCWLLAHHTEDDVTVNAVYDQASTIAETVEHIAEATGRRPRHILIREPLARFGVATLGAFESHRPPAKRVFHQRRVDKLTTSTNIITTTLPTLDYQFPHTARTALQAWLA